MKVQFAENKPWEAVVVVESVLVSRARSAWDYQSADTPGRTLIIIIIIIVIIILVVIIMLTIIIIISRHIIIMTMMTVTCDFLIKNMTFGDGGSDECNKGPLMGALGRLVVTNWTISTEKF